MKSIARKFEKLKQSRPGVGDFLNLSEAVTGRRFVPKTIRFWFNRLLDKDDYSQSDKKTLFAHLDKLSNPPRTV